MARRKSGEGWIYTSGPLKGQWQSAKDPGFFIVNPEVRIDYRGIADELVRLFPDPWALLEAAEERKRREAAGGKVGS